MFLKTAFTLRDICKIVLVIFAKKKLSLSFNSFIDALLFPSFLSFVFFSVGFALASAYQFICLSLCRVDYVAENC